MLFMSIDVFSRFLFRKFWECLLQHGLDSKKNPDSAHLTLDQIPQIPD